MKVVFFGTPEFAIPTLQSLIDSEHEILAVVTQPDKSVGRSCKLVFSPVKELALKHNIEVLQFEKIRKQGTEILQNLNADVFISAAYGQIFSAEILNASKYGMFNVHGSILPKLRGAAPIQWSLINGDKTTGITILRSDVGMDDGDIILIEKIDILPSDNAGTLFTKLADLGAVCLIKSLELLKNNTITYTPQDHSKATKCTMLSKELNKINFNQSARSVNNFVRGLNPWPIAECQTAQGRIKIFSANVIEQEHNYKAGEVIVANAKQGFMIACQSGILEVLQMQAENSKAMPAKSFLNGKQIIVGQIVNE